MPRRMLILLAHPDDETFGPGGTIVRYARQGVEIHLGTATRGEAGMLGDPPVTDREHAGEVRAAELGCAAAVLGIGTVTFMGFADGRLADTPRERIVGKCVEMIRRTRPHVLIGFGPEGISGHMDHVVMSKAALEAFAAADDPARFPEQLRGGLGPWGVSKLYQFEVSEEVFAAWNVPLRGVPPGRLTTFIDTSECVDRKIQAFYCHKTQARDYNMILSQKGYRDFARRETFVLAASRLSKKAFPETDLFQGIPPGEHLAP
jgi:LmbE family N-acetylglucosaminyl deacetylase